MEIYRERAAWEYYMLMASITHRIESSNVFTKLADVRFKNMQRIQMKHEALLAEERHTLLRAA